MLTYDNFTECYQDLIKRVYTDPEYEVAPRGMKIRETLGVQFKVENVRDRIPYVAARKFSISYMVAEMIWYLSGNDSTKWIANYSSFWNNISDDGKTANSAYGSRIFKTSPPTLSYDAMGKLTSSGFDMSKMTQWEYVKQELKRDPDSRRAVIHIRTPHDSFFAKLDVPCTMTLQYFIRDDKLHSIVSMRSSDLILGIAYDVPAFTVFQEVLAMELGVGLGTYTHISNSLHIYERDFKKCEKIITEDCRSMGAMPAFTRNPRTIMQRYIAIEDELREAKTGLSLKYFLGECVQRHNEFIFDEEMDWLKILASHRAGVQGNKELQRELLDSTTFEGYRFFKK